MNIGISTACFYPMETEKALSVLAENGIKTVEIFFNADCELEGDIYGEIKNILSANGISVLSVHPYTSAIETMTLFGDYPRRLTAIIDVYDRYFEIMNDLGAKIFVLHGALKSAHFLKSPDGEKLYLERYSMLFEQGRRRGITVAQENVSYCKSSDPDFLMNMKRQLGTECAFVLDVKQALRSGLDVFRVMDIMGDRLVHCHLSDNTPDCDCVPVGKGRLDFGRFAEELKTRNYGGGIILELYSSGFSTLTQLKESVEYMKGYF